MSQVLITGATGSQGLGVLRALASSNISVTIHALVRDPDSVKSRNLLEFASPTCSIKLFRGVFEDSASIVKAAHGCNVAFINLVPTFHDPGLEFTHMDNVVSAFLADDAVPLSSKYIIYSAGIGSHESREGLSPGFFKTLMDSKGKCHQYLEERCAAAGVSYTILQPGHFFSNWMPPVSDRSWPQLREKGSHILRSAFHPDLKLPCLDQTTLVGDVTAKLIADSSKAYYGKSIPLASQMLSMPDIADAMNKVLQRHGYDARVRVDCLSEEKVKTEMERGSAPPAWASHLWQNKHPYVVNVDEVRDLAGGYKSFEEFLVGNFEQLKIALGLAGADSSE